MTWLVQLKSPLKLTDEIIAILGTSALGFYEWSCNWVIVIIATINSQYYNYRHVSHSPDGSFRPSSLVRVDSKPIAVDMRWRWGGGSAHGVTDLHGRSGWNRRRRRRRLKPEVVTCLTGSRNHWARLQSNAVAHRTLRRWWASSVGIGTMARLTRNGAWRASRLVAVVQQPRWRQVGVRRPWGCGLRAGGVVRLGAANSTQSPAQKQVRMALPSIYMLSIDSLCVYIYSGEVLA
jgi:hypothetical protein